VAQQLIEVLINAAWTVARRLAAGHRQKDFSNA
jgi:hypothetical protein